MIYFRFLGMVILAMMGFCFGMLAIIVIIDEVIPRLKEGSLEVMASSTVLNHVWEGNEIYIVVDLYLVISVILFALTFWLVGINKRVGVINS